MSKTPIPIAVEVANAPPGFAPAVRRAVREATGRRRTGVISVAFVSDSEIACLNEEWLNHGGPTDVLSFSLAHDALDGQIVVSFDTARREAAERGHDWRAEALLYVVHGVLHLLGYDDRDPRDAAAMHRKEDAILDSLGYGRVYHGPRKGPRRATRRHPTPRRPRPAQRQPARRAPRDRVRRRR